LPDAHVEAAAHVWPFFFLHAPAASQVFAPVHVSRSSALVTLTHAPPPGVQVLQVPPHAPEQQMPSSQTPERQSAGLPQVPPAATTAKSSALERFWLELK
jgi:hypothetical protein